MDEIKRVVSYIKSCREADIDVTITIDKSRSHLILNALQKQIPAKTKVKTADEDVRVGRVIFSKGVKVHYCPQCGIAVTESERFCRNCGQALIY